jgi:hypothetical protein
MVRRPSIALILGAVSVGLLCLNAPAATQARASFAVARGSVAPEVASKRSESQIVVQWVFRAGDLLDCRTSATELRRAQVRFGTRIHVSVLAVDVDPGVVRALLRSERVTAEVVHLTEREYARDFGALQAPVVFVVRSGRVTEMFASGNTEGGGRRSGAALNSYLATQLQRPASPALAVRSHP